jgi:glycosyltransferase involved in cell wall biosynthesis
MEENRLSETIDYLSSLQPQLKTKGLEMLLVLVDDGSSDNTYKIMKKFADSTGNIALKIRHGGRGAALQAGVRVMRNVISRTDDIGIIAFSAADLKLPLEDILESIRYISEEGWSGVFLSKNLSGSLMVRSFSRRFLSLLFNKLVRLLFNFKYMDTQGVKFLKLDEKTFKILEKCTDNTFTYDTEVAIELNLNGAKIKEIPYHLRDSSETDSKVNFYASLLMGLGLIKLLKKTSIQRMNLFSSKFRV